ncbi:hypothetical protein N7541_002124 [Penicillium brevicompactum]|uniref:Retrotransposon Copia-like N-terminal domain-containing protein n=1 Tax=Penicillium brevicompactum TaxID=5074 RepID=A0A9W9RJC3_PENBR|nr:hypothetical protein N7541_002124 [Penicillium brevicompactum]
MASSAGPARGRQVVVASTTPYNTKGFRENGHAVHSNDEEDSDGDTGDSGLWKHQGDRLPETQASSHIDFVDIPKLKPDGSNFETWKRDVKQVLASLGIHQVLRYDIRRPKHSDPSRATWRLWSARAARWMTESLEPETCTQITIGLDGVDWTTKADNLFLEINKSIKVENKFSDVDREFNKWDSMRRADFASAIQYLQASQAQLDKLNDYKLRLPPFVCLSRILNELEYELPQIALIREILESNNSAPQDMCHDTFLFFFGKIKHAAERSVVSSSKSSRQSSQSRVRDLNKSTHQPVSENTQSDTRSDGFLSFFNEVKNTVEKFLSPPANNRQTCLGDRKEKTRKPSYESRTSSRDTSESRREYRKASRSVSGRHRRKLHDHWKEQHHQQSEYFEGRCVFPDKSGHVARLCPHS